MSTNNQRSSSKERFWRRMMRRRLNSGLSVLAFCEEHGLAAPTYLHLRNAGQFLTAGIITGACALWTGMLRKRARTAPQRETTRAAVVT